MSAEAKVAKLEGLLARIHGNRQPQPVGVLSALKLAHAPAPSLEDDEPELLIEETETPTVIAARAPTSAATPMEAALAGGVDDDEPELEIVVDEDDDEPELLIEEPDAPTAPLGTRAPRPPQPPTRQQSAPQRSTPQRSTPQQSTPQQSTPQRSTPQRSTPQRSTPQQSTPQQSTPQRSSAGAPQRLVLTDSPAAEVAKVVSQPTAISFGDLLDRTLALRPR